MKKMCQTQMSTSVSLASNATELGLLVLLMALMDGVERRVEMQFCGYHSYFRPSIFPDAVSS